MRIPEGGCVFTDYDGTGQWTCQVQGGISVEEAFSRRITFFRSIRFRIINTR